MGSTSCSISGPFFRKVPFVIMSLSGKDSQCLWMTQGCVLHSTPTQRFYWLSISAKVHW